MTDVTDLNTALAPVHPGEILLEEFLKPHGLSAGAAAKALFVPRTRIERLIRGETPVTVDTAMRLSRLLGATPQFWLNLQTAYDVRMWRERSRTGALPNIEAIAPLDAGG